MASGNYLPTEDQFLCSICLDVFTDPVSTPCGHKFCKNCINEHWNTTDQCLCPMCKKVFNTRPELNVNTFISEMVSQFRQSAQHKANSNNSEQRNAKPKQVQVQIPCDVCTGIKQKAMKSCLNCLTSYCETHLKPHLTATPLKRHQLIDPVENLEGRICMTHDEPLELFCKIDQTCVCMLCTVLDHKTHEVVPLTEEYEVKKTEIEMTEAEIQQMIQKAQLTIQEIKQSVDLSKKNADREKADGVRVITFVKECVESDLNKFTDTIEEKQRSTQKRAEDLIKELEQEISELKKRSTEMEQLSCSEDHLHFLQHFPYMKPVPPIKDWKKINIDPLSHEGTVLRALSQLEEKISEKLKKLVEADLKRVQQYEVDVTLDPDTAHPYLILSGDGKQVNPGEVKKHLSDNPQRFALNPCVLGKQSFSSGRFYYEVQVKGKTNWDLGVARESINRKEDIPLCPGEGYWTIWLRRRNKYKALGDLPVSLSLRSRPQKVGVFVDYEEGVVSFYDVETPALIYSFTGCSFTEKIYPYFNPGLYDGGKNSAPLVLSPK